MFLRLMILLLCATTAAIAQSGTKNGEWRTYGGDLGSTHYAPLDQITAANFSTLQVAWRFKTDALGPQPDFNLEATPLMVNGILYATAGSRRTAVAIDAATGELLWMYRLDEGRRAAESLRRLSGRGVGYWSDGRGDERIFFVTIGYQLVGLDARTGRPIAGFGRNGIVDLKQDDDQDLDPVTGGVAWNGAPVVAGDVVLVGSAHGGGRSKTAAKGSVRGFDARTGKRLWLFRTIPRAGEFGSETWDSDSWAYTGNTGVWTQISVDEQLGVAYLPVEDPTNDYYGGDRPGNNLFGSSLVAVDLRTGRRLWHFQLVHHPIWDYDIPTAPILADVTVDGKPVKIAAQPTKQGFLFVFDRQTGRPVWPIEERPVPQSTVPGERTSPTQPFPTKPRPYERQNISLEELIDFTPALNTEARQLLSRYRIGPVYTPGIEPNEHGKGLLYVPNGANWPGASFDPDTGFLYVYSQTLTRQITLTPPPRPARAMDAGYINSGRAGDAGDEDQAVAVQGLPIMKPPYARITAIDLNRGDIVWQVAHGHTPDHIRMNPALKGIDIPRTGRPGGPTGTLTTKTLVIAGETGFFTTASGQRGAMLRAYHKATGADAGEIFMQAPQTGTPMTYMLNDKQYLVVAIGGDTRPAELVAFRLP